MNRLRFKWMDKDHKNLGVKSQGDKGYWIWTSDRWKQALSDARACLESNQDPCCACTVCQLDRWIKGENPS